MTNFNGTAKSLPISQFQGMQTLVPLTVTYPRSSRHIYTDVTDTNLYKQRCHIILFYKSSDTHDSGTVLAGHAKESFGRATDIQPIIAGRVKIDDEKECDDVALEIVSNDCGVRLVEAHVPMTLSEFLELKDKEGAESHLVFWKDLDQKNPHLCPLFFVQVTNFQCGGYSVGISCSLLLADPSSITSFVINWAKLHSKMISENYFKKLPLFYRPNLMAAHTKNQIISDPIRSHNKSVIFTTKKKVLNHSTDEELVSICIQEAENELNVKANKIIRSFSVTSSEEITLQKYIREPVVHKYQDKLARVDWDQFGANEITFYEGNKPFCVSNWIYSSPGEVLTIIIPSHDEEDSQMSVLVSIP